MRARPGTAAVRRTRAEGSGARRPASALARLAGAGKADSAASGAAGRPALRKERPAWGAGPGRGGAGLVAGNGHRPRSGRTGKGPWRAATPELTGPRRCRSPEAGQKQGRGAGGAGSAGAGEEVGAGKGAAAAAAWPSWMEGSALHLDFRSRGDAGLSASQELELEYRRVSAERAAAEEAAPSQEPAPREATACRLEIHLGEFRPAHSVRTSAQSVLGAELELLGEDSDRALLERMSLEPGPSAAAAAQASARKGSARPRARPPPPRQRPKSALPAVPRAGRKKAESVADLCGRLADLGSRPEAAAALRALKAGDAEEGDANGAAGEAAARRPGQSGRGPEDAGRSASSGAAAEAAPSGCPLPLQELRRLVRALEARTVSQELTDEQCRKLGRKLAEVGSGGRHAIFWALDALGASAVGDFLLLQYNLAKTAAHERVLQRQMADAAIRDRTGGAPRRSAGAQRRPQAVRACPLDLALRARASPTPSVPT